jgi:heme/copper-type cytochrome/quinol oxidase subunit 2
VQAICSSDIPHKCSMITTFYEEMQYTNSVLDALVSTIFFDLVESLSYFDQFRSYKIHGFSISKILDCFVLPALQNFNKTDLSDLPLALNGKALHNIFLIDNNLQLTNDDNASQIQLFLDHCKGWKILSDVETTIGQLEKFTSVLPDIKSTKLLLTTYSLAYKEFVSLYLKPVHEKNLEIKNAVPVLTPTSSLNFARHHFAVKFDSYMKPTEYINEYQIRLLEVDKRVILPTQTGIRLLISSYDVLHSWAIPSMGIKLDGCPGRLNQTFLYIKEPGLFYGQCSEICGTQHAFMPISVRAIPAHEFNFWLAQQIEPIGQLAKHLETAKSANKK